MHNVEIEDWMLLV